MVWEPRVLSQFAHHQSSREPIPPHMVAAMREARAMFSATDLQAQVRSAPVTSFHIGMQCNASSTRPCPGGSAVGRCGPSAVEPTDAVRQRLSVGRRALSR